MPSHAREAGKSIFDKANNSNFMWPSDKNVGPLTSSGDFQLITIQIDLNRRRIQSNCINLRASRCDKGASASASFNYQLIISLRN